VPSRLRSFLIFIGICLLALASKTAAQGVLEPPYGLKWGDTPEKLISWASRHSLDVNISLPGDQPLLRVVRIQPRKGFLPGTEQSAVEGRFLSGKLFEMTVHYVDPDASAELMAERFIKMRKQLSIDHGNFVADQQQKITEDQFTTQTKSFHREPVKGLFLLLAYTEVEDMLRKSKEARYSLIYRNDNLRMEIERVTTAPAVPTGEK
jgi:hypothetical protein